MPTSPDTPLILDTIQAKIQALQVDGSTFFTPINVIAGKHKDVTNHVPAGEVTATDDLAKRWTTGSGVVQGGQIDDTQVFLIEITLDYTDAQLAEVQLAKIRDSFTKAFFESATLNLQNRVYKSKLQGKGRRGYSLRNGQTWRVYQNELEVGYAYTVIVQP